MDSIFTSNRVYVAYLTLLVVACVVAAFVMVPDWQMTRLMRKGDEQLNAGQNVAALATFEKAFEWDPQNGVVRSRLANLYLNVAPEKGVEHFEAHLSNADGTYLDHFWMIRYLEKLGRHESIPHHVEALLSLRPNDPHALLFAGRQAQRENRADDAARYLGKAHKLNKDDPEVTFYWAKLLAESSPSLHRLIAKSLLMQLAQGESAYSSDALFLLLENKGLFLYAGDDLVILPKLIHSPENLARLDTLNNVTFRSIVERVALHFPEEGMRLYQKLIERTLGQKEDRMAFIQLGIAQKKWSEAEEQIQLLLMDEPDDVELNILLARCQMNRTNGQEIAVGRLKRILAEQPDNLQVCQTLVQQLAQASSQSTVEASTVKALVDLLLAHPKAEPKQKLMAYQRWLEVKPQEKDTIIKDALHALASAIAPETIMQWLLSLKANERVLAHFDEQEVLLNSVLFEGYHQALLNLKKFEQADSFFEKGRGLLGPVVASLRQCERYTMVGDKQQAMTHWREAFGALEEGRHAVWLAQLAYRLAEFEEVMKAYQRCAALGATLSSHDWIKFFTASVYTRQFDEAVSISVQALSAFPDEPIFRNNFAYLNLLMERDVEVLTEKMEALVEKYPQVSTYKMTLALGYFRMGNSNKALQLIENSRIDISEKNPSDRAIYAAILAANGKTQVAASMVRGIKKEQLIPWEYELISMFAE